MSNKHHEFRTKLAKFLSKYIVMYSGLAVVLFFIGAVISFFAFPDAGMAAFVMVTLSGLSSLISDFAQNLISAEAERTEKERDKKQDEMIDKLDDQ